jgi:uncharacterized protein (TIGR00255 family)
MTGFGRHEVNSEIGRITVELASVNNRFLEFSIRLPRPLALLEPKIREYLNGKVSRGKVTASVSFDEATDRPENYIINRVALRAYVEQLRKAQKELKLGGEIDVSALVALPEVVTSERIGIVEKQAWEVVERALAKALTRLVAMRAREGRAMATDMRARLKTLSGLIKKIEKRTSNASQVYAKKLKERIEGLLQGPARDQQRLEEEIAYFAERTDIAEECTRFYTHVEEFRATLNQREAVGRRLNFILQEMNREANTIGSKSADFDISAHVISLKEEIEKIREMVQNVE